MNRERKDSTKCSTYVVGAQESRSITAHIWGRQPNKTNLPWTGSLERIEYTKRSKPHTAQLPPFTRVCTLSFNCRLNKTDHSVKSSFFSWKVKHVNLNLMRVQKSRSSLKDNIELEPNENESMWVQTLRVHGSQWKFMRVRGQKRAILTTQPCGAHKSLWESIELDAKREHATGFLNV